MTKKHTISQIRKQAKAFKAPIDGVLRYSNRHHSNYTESRGDLPNHSNIIRIDLNDSNRDPYSIALSASDLDLSCDESLQDLMKPTQPLNIKNSLCFSGRNLFENHAEIDIKEEIFLNEITKWNANLSDLQAELKSNKENFNTKKKEKESLPRLFIYALLKLYLHSFDSTVYESGAFRKVTLYLPKKIKDSKPKGRSRLLNNYRNAMNSLLYKGKFSYDLLFLLDIDPCSPITELFWHLDKLYTQGLEDMISSTSPFSDSNENKVWTFETSKFKDVLFWSSTVFNALILSDNDCGCPKNKFMHKPSIADINSFICLIQGGSTSALEFAEEDFIKVFRIAIGRGLRDWNLSFLL